MIRVLIADDQPLVRRGLSLILAPHPDIEVVGEAGDGAEAVTLAQELHPDVVAMDIRMPVMDGVRATGELALVRPGCRVLALSTFDMDEYVVAALRAGCLRLPVQGRLARGADRRRPHRPHRTGEAAVAPRLLTRLISTYVRTAAREPRPAPAAPPDSPRASWRSGGCSPPDSTTPRSPRNWTSASPPSRTTSLASSASCASATGRRRSSRRTSRVWSTPNAGADLPHDRRAAQGDQHVARARRRQAHHTSQPFPDQPAAAMARTHAAAPNTSSSPCRPHRDTQPLVSPSAHSAPSSSTRKANNRVSQALRGPLAAVPTPSTTTSEDSAPAASRDSSPLSDRSRYWSFRSSPEAWWAHHRVPPEAEGCVQPTPRLGKR